MAALPALRVLVCTRIDSRQSRSDRQLVYASCPWAVDGQALVSVSSVIFGVGGAAFLRLAWVLGSKYGRCARWLSLAWC